MEQWQNFGEQKDIKVVVDSECKCQRIGRKLRKLKKKGVEEKDFLIMTDNVVDEEKGRLVLSDSDYIMEEDPETLGKAFERIVRRCG